MAAGLVLVSGGGTGRRYWRAESWRAPRVRARGAAVVRVRVRISRG